MSNALAFGGKDTQVPSNIMIAKLQKVQGLNGKLFIIKVLPQANHLFQKAKSGMPSTYGILPKQFVSGFLETIVEWLNKFKYVNIYYDFVMIATNFIILYFIICITAKWLKDIK